MRKLKKRFEQSGTLVVVGKASVVIPLLDFPHRVEVYFKKKSVPLPCDPGPKKKDKLVYKVYRHYLSHCRHTYTLFIEWKVKDIREITWNVYYC
jgi:hypothetical protein